MYYLLVLFLSIACCKGAVVAYVPTPACTTPTGCDFKSAIWNITGVPSQDDNVYIYSEKNVDLTIYINNSDVTLASLTIGGDSSSYSVTLILYNSALYFHDNSIFQWSSGDSYSASVLVYQNSYLYSSGNVMGENLVVEDSSNVNIHNFAATRCTVSNSDINIDTFKVESYTQINGSLWNDEWMEYTFANFTDTDVAIVQTTSLSSNFYYYTTQPSPASLVLGGTSDPSYLLEAHFSDNVVATLSGFFTSLRVGDLVYINVDQYGFYKGCQIGTISQSTPILSPTIFSLASNLTLVNNQDLNANVSLLRNGSLLIYTNAVLNEVRGNGTLILGDEFASQGFTSLTVGDLAVPKLFFYNNVTLNLNSPFKVPHVYGDCSQLVVNTAKAFVKEIVLYNSSLIISGTYTQTGYIHFNSHYNNSIPSPLITITGSVYLDNVTLEGYLPADMDKLIVIRSTNDSLNTTLSQFNNTLEASRAKINITINELSIIRDKGGIKSEFNLLLIIAGAVLLGLFVIVIGFLVIRNCKQETGYTPINN